MRIFVSWSGNSSREIAVTLRSWLPRVLAGRVTAFVSSEDIEKGARGLPTIAEELETAGYGIVVVTPANQNSTWINFEAGALGKSVSNGRVAPLLVGMSDAEVTGPLKQFQNTAASDRTAMHALIRSLNSTLLDPLPAEAVDTLFDANWDQFTQTLSTTSQATETTALPPRGEGELLEEVLITIRALQREVSVLTNLSGTGRQSLVTSAGSVHDDKLRVALGQALSISKIFSFGHRIDGNTLIATLPEGAPPVQSESLHQILDVARRADASIRLTREDGSWLKINGDSDFEQGTEGGTEGD